MVLQATKKIFRVIQEVSELGGMGLLPGWAGRQTLMHTSSPGYMNPIPCGVKVNDAGTPPVPRSRQNPPTYKRSA